MKKVLRFFVLIIALIVLFAGAFVGKKFYDKYSEGTKEADLYQYFSFATKEQGAIMKDGAILDDYCRVLNDVCYVNIKMVQTYLHNRFYYSDLDREIRYTDSNSIVVAPLDGNHWRTVTIGSVVNSEEPYVIAFTMDDSCFVALDFVEKFVPITHTTYTNPNRVVINSMGVEREVIRVKKDTVVRWRAGVKSDILTYVEKDQALLVLKDQDAEGWCKVATEDGFVGYVRNTKLGAREKDVVPNTLTYVEPEYVARQLDTKIRMGFHAVYNKTANSAIDELLETAYNLNVISPSWFVVSDNYGNLQNFASKEYVDKAHARGVQVWALAKDFDTPTNVDMYQVLASSENRARLINNLVVTVNGYDIDGINVDFESVRKQEGAHFVQFLRELYIACQEYDIILSVDNYPPNAGNQYYDYREQSIIADYVVLMGYDEHWGGSGDPGSTASQPFVEQSLDNLLSMVDASKVINALPFYTRLWQTSVNGVEDRAIVMSAMDEAIEKYNLTVTYDEETGLKYGTSNVDGTQYQMWIEDLDSIENKLKAVELRDLAGVAAWRLSYEEKEVWDLIGKYIP